MRRIYSNSKKNIVDNSINNNLEHLNASTFKPTQVIDNTLQLNCEHILNTAENNHLASFNNNYLDKDNNSLTNKSIDLEREHIINTTKKSIDIMLLHASKNNLTTLDNKLLNKIVTVLRKNNKEYTIEDEIKLWSSYHELALLIKPATDIGIAINLEMANMNLRTASSWEFLKFWKHPRSNLKKLLTKCIFELFFITIVLVLSTFLYFKIQMDCEAMNLLINEVNTISTELEQKNKIASELKTINNQSSILDSIDSNIKSLNYKFAVSIYILSEGLENIIIMNSKSKEYKNISNKFCKNIIDNKYDFEYLKTCEKIALTEYKIIYKFFSQFILPLSLGIMGSAVYMARKILEQLQAYNYEPMLQSKMIMRILLGGLLGVISGIFISTVELDSELHKLNLNMVLLPFILGYSVDITFSLLDKIVKRINESIQSIKLQKEHKT